MNFITSRSYPLAVSSFLRAIFLTILGVALMVSLAVVVGSFFNIER
jgi:hypothetical protein